MFVFVDIGNVCGEGGSLRISFVETFWTLALLKPSGMLLGPLRVSGDMTICTCW
jgi:hypothetical protein